MLVDADYRRWVVRQVRDPFVKQFWEQEFENYDPRFMREAIAPIQNKVGALLQSPMLRKIHSKHTGTDIPPVTPMHGKHTGSGVPPIISPHAPVP